mmetsp:Transcript_819/g.1330  ORF Transcript_819/g.1330 Transcript_819/m.1330 type:complete len:130 (-) Transcript_819:44-433(-)
MQSFQNVSAWYGLVRKLIPEDQLPCLALVGNKIEMRQAYGQVSVEKHQTFAQQNKMKAFFVSAKTAEGVSSLFYSFAADIANLGTTETAKDTTPKRPISRRASTLLSSPKQGISDPSETQISRIGCSIS